MAVTLQCPRCEHKQKIDDDKVGKEVPCRVCHHMIKPAGSKASAKPKLPPDDAEEGKGAAIKAGAPAGPNGKAKAAAPPMVKAAKDEDDDDFPRSRRRRRDEEDDDDRDDDRRGRPNRRTKQSSSGGMMMAILGVGAVLLVLFACGGAGI